MTAGETKDKVEDWFERAESNKHHGAITISVRPGNPHPQFMIERKETEA